MREHFLRRTAHAPQFLDKLVFGQVVRGRLDRKVRRTAARNEQRRRLSRTFASQQTRELETNQAAHAVTEESERPVHVTLDRVGNRTDQRLDADKARKPQLCL